MKLKYIYFFLIPLIAGILLLTAFKHNKVTAEVKTNNSEIIKFSHSFHVELAECADCHIQVVSSTSLTERLMPNHESCKSCHDVEDADACTTCHYEEKFEALVQKESGLIFNHSFHINDKSMECKNCHQGLSDVDYSSELAFPNPIMEDCYSCHNNAPGSIAGSECESCHISTANLKPQTHKSAMFIDQHKFSARGLSANCVMCHDNNSCEECHIATGITAVNTSKDFIQSYTPGNFIDGIKKQRITRIHDLNYRFTHGMDAKGKTTECQTCHEVETFCSTCHASVEHDFALGGIMPASHLKNNFFTIGVGSGGGEHATLAKRDIEMCASCHDVQGADPTCITCHLDSDGIKGTNPKTHPLGFMKDEEGDWHNDRGSICYNCHSSASPQTPVGIGFCGYCHGAN